MQEDDDLLFFNGVNGATGQDAVPPMHSTELLRALTKTAAPPNLADLRVRQRQDAEGSEAVARLCKRVQEAESALRAAGEAGGAASIAALTEQLARIEAELRQRQHLGVREDIDASVLDQAGWGAVFAEDEDPAIIEALQPLLDLRREQAGSRFRLFCGAKGYRGGGRDSKSRFLLRNGATAAGPVSPEAVPYYVLIVGSPERIPFEFQHQLDVQYAVGRLHFDTVEEYARYARSVVSVEQRPPARARRLALFDVANPMDRATQLSSQKMIGPLCEVFRSSEPGWSIERIPPSEASKERLSRLLAQEDPALLFTASHGVEFPAGSPQQRSEQGALLCQDWPGPSHVGAIPHEYYLSAADVSDSAQVHGLLLFLFACFSAGTPERDSFQRDGSPVQRAPKPFVSALPQRLLSHPQGGALAVVGHIDRAWGYSFAWPGGAQRVHTAAMESTLRRLLRGERLGYAMEYMNQRYAELATVLQDELDAVRNLRQPDPRALAELWTATQDARGYCVLGDPAVRISASEAAPPPSSHAEGPA